MLEATNLLEAQLDKDLLAAALTRDGAKFNRNTSNAIELETKARAASGYRPADDDVQREARRLGKPKAPPNAFALHFTTQGNLHL